MSAPPTPSVADREPNRSTNKRAILYVLSVVLLPVYLASLSVRLPLIVAAIVAALNDDNETADRLATWWIWPL